MTHIRAALSAIAFNLSLLGLVAGSASAQTSPSGTPGSNAVPTPIPSAASGAPSAKKPIAILHLLPLDTSMVGSSDLPRPVAAGGASGNHAFTTATLRFGYGAQIFLGKAYLSFTHSYIDQNNGRVTTVKNAYTYPNLNYDRVDDGSLNYVIDSVVASVGYHQRVRECCGNNVDGAAEPTAYHYLYAQGATRFGPDSKRFGRILGLTLNVADVPHNTSPFFASPYCVSSAANCLTPAYGAIASEGNKIKFTYTANATVPFGNPKTTSLALFATYFNNWDYYESSPIMYLYNTVDIGFVKKFSPYVSMTVTDSNQYQHHQIYQYVYPNTINRNKLTAAFDFAVPIR